MKNQDHLLCFVADDEGQLFIHADAAGLDLLIGSLTHIRKRIDEEKCDHDHLMTESWGGQGLTEAPACGKDGRILHHVKIYGWTEEWARKHDLKN
jgi:hypothetical protein